MRAAVTAGLAAGLAVASLGGIGTASATCLSVSGIINLGSGCTSTLGSFAIGIGPGTTASAEGFFNGAIATGSDTTAGVVGSLSAAYVGGTGSSATTIGTLNYANAGLPGSENLIAVAGTSASDYANFSANWGTAEALGQSTVETGDGAVNFAANLFGNGSESPLSVSAHGTGASAFNWIANRSQVSANGVLVNATNVGNPSFPSGSDSKVTAGTGDAPARLSLALNWQGFLTEACNEGNCGNFVDAGTGPFGLAAGINVAERKYISQSGTGVTIATPFDDTGITAPVLAAVGAQETLSRLDATGSGNDVPAAGGAQRSHVRPRLSARFNDTKATEVTSPGRSARTSVSDGITRSTKRFNDKVTKLNDNIRRVTGGLGGGTKAATTDVGKRSRADASAGERPHRDRAGSSDK